MQGDNKLDRDAIRKLETELVGAALHGAIYVGRTPEGFDGATKDDVCELAGQVAELLNDGWQLVSRAELDAAENALVDAVEERDIATARCRELETALRNLLGASLVRALVALNGPFDEYEAAAGVVVEPSETEAG